MYSIPERGCGSSCPEANMQAHCTKKRRNQERTLDPAKENFLVHSEQITEEIQYLKFDI